MRGPQTTILETTYVPRNEPHRLDESRTFDHHEGCFRSMLLLCRTPTLARACAAGGLVTAVLLGACGRKSAPTAPSPTGGTAAATITITSAGASPREVRIRAGNRVSFVNNDTRDHEIASDPHPEHTDCPELNQVGFLRPGQSRETGNLVTPRTCGFHDHLLPAVDSLRGRIIVEP